MNLYLLEYIEYMFNRITRPDIKDKLSSLKVMLYNICHYPVISEITINKNENWNILVKLCRNRSLKPEEWSLYDNDTIFELNAIKICKDL